MNQYDSVFSKQSKSQHKIPLSDQSNRKEAGG